MKELLTAAYGLVRSPFIAYQAMLASRPWRMISRLVLLSRAPVNAAILVMVISLLQKQGVLGVRASHLNLALVLAAPLLAMGEWLISAALLAVVARLAGSKARFGDTLLVYGYAQVPYLFVLPALLFPFSVLQLAIFLANGWSLILLFIGIFLSHGLGRGRTLLILLASQLLVPLLLSSAVFLR